MGKVLGGGSKPKAPKPDPEIERRRQEEERKAEEEKQRQIQENLRNETLVGTGSSSRNSLLTKGRRGFNLRSLLGG